MLPATDVLDGLHACVGHVFMPHNAQYAELLLECFDKRDIGAVSDTAEAAHYAYGQFRCERLPRQKQGGLEAGQFVGPRMKAAARKTSRRTRISV